MILGILSDTHNHLDATRRALAALAAAGEETLVHCGDIGDDALDLLSAECLDRGIRAWAALGNCDGWSDAAVRPAPAGITLARTVFFDADGKSCAVMHGDDAWGLYRLAASGRLDYLFTGHTHRPSLETSGRTVLLNPGSAARPRNDIPTVAVLDTATGAYRWIPLE
ncbi:MAG: YfcE family phosphodiesterase [Kiritimatiellae bacterium]|nr:YfcE family phosphodiesterase [Kiritimatiellia bacterium]